MILASPHSCALLLLECLLIRDAVSAPTRHQDIGIKGTTLQNKFQQNWGPPRPPGVNTLFPGANSNPWQQGQHQWPPTSYTLAPQPTPESAQQSPTPSAENTPGTQVATVTSTPSSTIITSTPSSTITTTTSTITTTSSVTSAAPSTLTTLSTLTTTSSVASAAPSTFTTPTTLISTSAGPSTSTTPAIIATSISTIPNATPSPAPSGLLQISIVNNVQDSRTHAYITGLDSNGLVVMLTTDGTFYYPSSSSGTPQKITANTAIPLSQGQTTVLTLPGYISAARAWFSDGKLTFSAVGTPYGTGLVEPTAVSSNEPHAHMNWGFVEFTYNSEEGLFVNLSFVDFVGLPLGIQLQTSSGTTQSALGTAADAVAEVCKNLKAQASKDGQPWDKLCVYNKHGSLVRVLSPSSALANSVPGAFSGYFDDYIDQVWNHYATSPLTINTQSAAGNVTCTTSGNSLTCEGDNRSYAKPTASDIFGCSTGTFSVLSTDNAVHQAVVPRLCAAFNRATLLVAGGNVQPSLPPSAYYTTSTNNWYSAFVHQAEINGNGYAFPYDDVTPSIQYDTAGVLAAPNPQQLTVFVGGYSSG